MLSPLPFSDGPIDATMDVSHLNEKEKARRRALYQRWFKRNGKTVTASGQKLQFDLETFSNFKAKRVKYIQEGQVSCPLFHKSLQYADSSLITAPITYLSNVYI